MYAYVKIRLRVTLIVVTGINRNRILIKYNSIFQRNFSRFITYIAKINLPLSGEKKISRLLDLPPSPSRAVVTGIRPYTIYNLC